MIEKPMPQDILKYKSKIIGNFTVRQAVWGGAGVIVIGICAFSIFEGISDSSMRALISVIPALPFFLIGFFPIYGVPFEKIIIPLVYDNFIYPIIRKKEVHYPEMEAFEKTRTWQKNKPGKIRVRKSKKLKAIK